MSGLPARVLPLDPDRGNACSAADMYFGGSAGLKV